MFKRLTAIILLSCLLSCSKEEPVPEHMDKQKMSEVMTDLTLMEAALSAKTGIDPTRTIDSNSCFNIYRQHNISRAFYDSSLSYYSKRPKEFKEVYDLVVEKLNKMKPGK
jgi:hypothetical protein